MAATLSTIRIGETLSVHATLTNSDGTIGSVPVNLSSIQWDAGTGPEIEVSVNSDSGDPLLAYVTGLVSGTGEVRFRGSDAFNAPFEQIDPAIVLNASRFKFSMGSLLFEPNPIESSITGIKLAAYGWDSRDDDPGTIYPYGPGSPPTGIYDVVWSSANQAVLFGGLASGSPPGTTTYADSLTVDIYPDTTSAAAESTTDVVTITAKNNAGATITGTINVVIRRVVTVAIDEVVV